MRIDFRVSRRELKALTRTGLYLLVIIALIPFVQLALISSCRAPREMSPLNIDKNDIKQIGLALTIYNEQNGHYPPAGETSTNTKPVCSWRVSILPQIDRADLYKTYDMERPWNVPPNDVVADIQMEAYCDFFNKDSPLSTKVAAITGVGTVWDPTETYEELPESTIVAVQVSGSDIQWAEPRDLSLSELKRLVQTGGQDTTIGEVNIGPWILFADTAVVYFPEQFPLDRLLKLTTIQGAKGHDRRELLEEFAGE